MIHIELRQKLSSRARHLFHVLVFLVDFIVLIRFREAADVEDVLVTWDYEDESTEMISG